MMRKPQECTDFLEARAGAGSCGGPVINNVMSESLRPSYFYLVTKLGRAGRQATHPSQTGRAVSTQWQLLIGPSQYLRSPIG